MHKAFQRVQQKFKKDDPDHRKMKEALEDLRDGICDIVKNCSTNVQVVIYMDGVLDDPITAKAGNGDNRLRMTIKRNGTFTYGWTKETWGKFFHDAWERVTSLMKNILGFIISCASKIYSVACEIKNAITEK